MEGTPKQGSEVTKYLDEADMLSYRLADKLDMVLAPSMPSVGLGEKNVHNPSLLVTRLQNLVAQLRDIDNRLNI